MRVISGIARGRKLCTLEGEDVRPTTDKVKESVFNIIQFEIENCRVLDLFAGSGQLGIEALSRGARECVFVDSSKKSLDVVKKNLQLTSLADRAETVLRDAQAFLRCARQKFDIIFLDPPYASGLLEKVIPAAQAVLADGGIMICESPTGTVLPEEAGRFILKKSYKYGKITISVYRQKEDCDGTNSDISGEL